MWKPKNQEDLLEQYLLHNMDLIIGATYKPLARINGEEIPRRMKLVSADLRADKFKLKSTDSFLTAEMNRFTLELYFSLLEEK